MTPPKEIMGVTLPSEPPPAPPRPAPEPPAPPPSLRKDSPAGGIKIQGKGWHISMPHVALVAVLTTLGGWFGKDAVSKGERAELGDVLREVKALRKDVANVRGDVADLAEEQRKARGNDRKLLAYVDESLKPMVASLRKLGVKLTYEGDDRAADVEFHPPPGPGSTAPPVQPRAALPERPQL